jgi:hypothetical protein
MKCSIPFILVAMLLCGARTTRGQDPPANNGGLFDFGKERRQPGVKPKAPAATQPAKIGPAEVKVVSTHFDYVPLGPSTEHGPAPENADITNSQDKFLLIKIEIRNTGDRPLTYHTFALPFGPSGRETYASLSFGQKMLTLVNFGDLEPQGLTRTAQVPPGKSVTDVLVFLPIPELDARSSETPLRLALPPQQLAQDGKPLRVDVAFSTIQRRP